MNISFGRAGGHRHQQPERAGGPDVHATIIVAYHLLLLLLIITIIYYYLLLFATIDYVLITVIIA